MHCTLCYTSDVGCLLASGQHDLLLLPLLLHFGPAAEALAGRRAATAPAALSPLTISNVCSMWSLLCS